MCFWVNLHVDNVHQLVNTEMLYKSVESLAKLSADGKMLVSSVCNDYNFRLVFTYPAQYGLCSVLILDVQCGSKLSLKRAYNKLQFALKAI